MAVLGSTAKPTTAQEGHGLNVTNQMAQALTLPAGGPWRIYRLGGWIGGWNSSPRAKLALWTSAASLVRSGPQFSVANHGNIVLGGTTNYEQNIDEYIVAGGTTVYVGWWRHSDDATQNGQTSSGSHLHDTAGDAPATMSGWSTHSGGGGIGSYLYYEAANNPPNAPTIVEPDQNEVVTDTTPVIDWTFSDPDGDSQNAYEVEIDNSSGFGSPAVDTGKVTSSTTQYTVSPALARGTTYYVRVRTWDPSGEVSPWSATRTFKIAASPTATVSTPAGSVAMPMYYTAGSNTTPKIRTTWTFSCPDGGTQTSASVKVYLAGGALQHTHSHSGSTTTADISGFTPVNGTKYEISVTPTCSHAVTGSESPKKSGQVRWGRASYYVDLTTTPVTLAVSTSSTSNSGQVIMEYTSTGSTAEPTTWYSSIASATKNRYAWHRVTLLPQSVASPVSPALNSVTWTYSNNVLVPDNWTLSSVASLDEGTYVYGTHSLKQVGDGITARHTHQNVPVVPNTDYILSGRVKTQGIVTGDTLRVLSDDGAITLAAVVAASDTDWTRYQTPVFNSGEASEVRVSVRVDSTSGTTIWADALKLEASRVVTPWTPGFLGQAVVLDAGGLQIDAQKGGVLRLRGANSVTADIQEIIDAARPSIVRMERVTSAQSIVSGTVTTILFNSTIRENDEAGDYTLNDPGTGEIRVKRAGWYRVAGGIQWAANASGRREMYLRRNGASIAGATAPATDFGSIAPNLNASNDVYLALDDIIRVDVRQSSGVNLDVNASATTFLSIQRIRT